MRCSTGQACIAAWKSSWIKHNWRITFFDQKGKARLNGRQDYSQEYERAGMPHGLSSLQTQEENFLPRPVRSRLCRGIMLKWPLRGVLNAVFNACICLMRIAAN
jgi:hypothetical protein